MTKTVAVAIPTYNRPDTLWLALYSVLMQSSADFSVYVSDNGTDPRTSGVVEEFVPQFRGRDITLSYNVNGKNRMCGGGINDCIQRSNEPYITVLADDDMWPPDRLEVMMNHVDKDCLLLYGHSYGFVNETGTIHKYKSTEPRDGYRPIDVVTHRFWINPLAVLYDRRFFDRIGFFNEEVLLEDLDMWIRLVEDGSIPMRIIDKFLAFYRIPDFNQKSPEYYRRVVIDREEIIQEHLSNMERLLLRFNPLKLLRRPWLILPRDFRRVIKTELIRYRIPFPAPSINFIGSYDPPFTYEKMLEFLAQHE